MTKDFAQIAQLAFVDRPSKSQIAMAGPKLRISSSLAEYLGLALHELATNALKHGALSVPGGKVRVHWVADEAAQRFKFEWEERDGPTVARPQREGFGQVILKTVVPAVFGGTATLHTPADGVSWHLQAPLSKVISPEEDATAIPEGCASIGRFSKTAEPRLAVL